MIILSDEKYSNETNTIESNLIMGIGRVNALVLLYGR